MTPPVTPGPTAIRDTVLAFNHCINQRDLDALSKLMTADHVFIDAAGNSVAGREACVAAWSGFFVAFPDYRNIFERFSVMGSRAVILGRSACSDPRLAGPALWTARVGAGMVAEWRVYDDSDANRAALGVAD
jgi:ketosteroid isomerase-like protein